MCYVCMYLSQQLSSKTTKGLNKFVSVKSQQTGFIIKLETLAFNAPLFALHIINYLLLSDSFWWQTQKYLQRFLYEKGHNCYFFILFGQIDR